MNNPANIFEAAAALPAAERPPYLDAACANLPGGKVFPIAPAEDGTADQARMSA